MTLRRRLSDACGAVALDARRPSIRSDLLIVQTKQRAELTEDADDDVAMSTMKMTSCTQCVIL